MGRVSVAGEDLLGDGHRGHGLGPAGVEREVGDGFDQFGFGVPVAAGEVEVEHELIGVAERGEGGDGDQAAFLGGQFGTVPHLAEQDVVGEPDEGGGEVAEHALARRTVRLLSVSVIAGSPRVVGSSRRVAATASGLTMAST